MQTDTKLEPHLRNILVQLAKYCQGHLKLNNSDIGKIFRRDRSDIKRMVDSNKPKRVR